MMNRKTVFVVKMVIVHLGSMYLHVGREALLFFCTKIYDERVKKKTYLNGNGGRHESDKCERTY